jgi:hypothetical protein
MSDENKVEAHHAMPEGGSSGCVDALQGSMISIYGMLSRRRQFML